MLKKICFLCLVSLFFISCKDNGEQKPNNSGNKETFYGEPFANVPDINEIVMYEANQRIFSPNNSFQAITAHLDNIKSLGVNVLWLMPITEQGKEKAFGSPYCVKNYKKTEPEYGTLDDLRNLVEEAHNRDIAVIIDWVANHTSWDNNWVSNNPSWYTKDANGNIVPPAGTNWNDVVDLNYDSQNMRKAMIDAMKYWIREANIDGFRCDAADFVPADFWKDEIHELRKMQDGRKIIMLAEGTEVANLQAGFDLDYGWNFCDVLEGLYNNKKNVSDLFNSNKTEFEIIPAKKQKLRFSTNHDRASENSPITLFNSQKGALSAFTLACTMGGVPLIYSSQEVGYSDKLSFFYYQSIDWNSHPEVFDEYKKIMNIWKKSSALKDGVIQTYTNKDIVNFSRSDDKQTFFVAVNIRNNKKTLTIPQDLVGTTWKNEFENTSITLSELIEMEEYEYLILSR